MDKLLIALIQLSGGGLLISGILTRDWGEISIGVALVIAGPFVGPWLVHQADHKISNAEQHHEEIKAEKAEAKNRQGNHEQIGFEYFKATFLFAGHIAQADGVICDKEVLAFEKICLRLQLDKSQKQAAQDYFNQGGHKLFDEKEALNIFVHHCGKAEVLCENFLQTQFSFAEASGEVVFAELHILELISQRLNAKEIYYNLLEEYHSAATTHAETIAQQKVDELKRQRDKKRIEAEEARIEREQKEKLAKLNPAQREMRLAFAVLGIKVTKDHAVIKRAYREQIKRHHPDYLLSQGYPDELLQEATERSVKINQAYRLLKKTLNFS